MLNKTSTMIRPPNKYITCATIPLEFKKKIHMDSKYNNVTYLTYSVIEMLPRCPRTMMQLHHLNAFGSFSSIDVDVLQKPPCKVFREHAVLVWARTRLLDSTLGVPSAPIFFPSSS